MRRHVCRGLKIRCQAGGTKIFLAVFALLHLVLSYLKGWFTEAIKLYILGSEKGVPTMITVFAIGAATLAWFVTAAILFFNPVVDRLYRAQESDPAARKLPQQPSTIAKILVAVLVQCVLWAFVYLGIADALSDDALCRGLQFAGLITVVKLVPRDIDRLLLTTYPSLRMGIEFVIGIPCAVVVGLVFAYML